MKITIDVDEKSTISLASGIGALRSLVAQGTFSKDDLEEIKELFKQIEQQYIEKLELAHKECLISCLRKPL